MKGQRSANKEPERSVRLTRRSEHNKSPEPCSCFVVIFVVVDVDDDDDDDDVVVVVVDDDFRDNMRAGTGLNWFKMGSNWFILIMITENTRLRFSWE
jgi:hypothetical protein